MSAFALKVIASVCMLIDHIGAVFAASTPYIFRWVGRIAFPIYAYMIAQGCKYTKNINKYLLRLGAFAIVSEIPFDMAFMHYTEEGLVRSINFLRDTNVFYTLFLGVACIAVYEKMKTKRCQWPALIPIPFVLAILSMNFTSPLSNYGPAGAVIPESLYTVIPVSLYAVGALCFANFLQDVETAEEVSASRKIIPFLTALPLLVTAHVFNTDYAAFGVGLIFFLYLADPANRITRTMVLAAGVIYLYGYNLNGYLLFAIAAVVFVLLYNGRQGPKAKWAFYAFYPAHIAALAAVWHTVGVI